MNIEELDPGIRRHVLSLRDAGFETTDSGDGISKLGGPGEGCMLDAPNIAIVLPAVDCLIEEALGAQRVLDEIEDGWRVEACWSTYDRVPVLLCLRVPS